MRSRRFWLLVFFVWTVLGVLSASQHLAYRAYEGRAIAWVPVIGRTMLDWYTCGIFTPAIFAVARRFRLDSPGWMRALPVHAAACALFIVLKLAIFLPLASAFDWLGEERVFTSWIYADAFPLTLAYAAVVGARYAFDNYERYRERVIKTAELETRLTRVQLEALRGQLHPHFLFNTLNALSALVHRDPEAADRMILELSELLRHTLTNDAPPEITLREELAFVQRYLSIMQIRYGDRLRVRVDITDEAQEALVPNMLLQPLVENALVHGIGRVAGEGELIITARRDGDALQIEVLDDGPGLPAQSGDERVGLRNTRAILEQLYRKEQELVVRNRNGRGVVARVLLPFHATALAR
jgi:two-component system, LytTR family, sensor kinase